MHKIIRFIHYYSSLFLIIFILMYVVSGLIMINHKLIPSGEPVQTVRRVALDIKMHGDPADYKKIFRQKYELSGRMEDPVERKDGSLRYWYYRPGTTHELIVTSARDSVKITRTDQQTLGRVVNRLHHVRGYGGGFVYNLWAILVDCTTVSMILFALTGIYLWYKRTKKKIVGLIVLSLGFLLPWTVIVFLMLSK